MHPRRFARLSVLTVSSGLALLAACADEGSSSDPGETDAGSGPETSTSTDSGGNPSGDSGPTATFTVGGNVTGILALGDGGVPEGGVPEGGVAEGGVPEAGVPEGGIADGGAIQALKLRNNGADELTASTNGPFTFATKLASGKAYAVTVAANPTGHTCSVGAGTGTIASANVSSVAVTCAPNQYTVTANVTGLAKAGLVLQNNAGNDLTVAAAGKLAFTQKVAYGSPFAVTIKTQPPARPLQKCTADANSSGIMTGDVEVAITCADDFLTKDAYDADQTFVNTGLPAIVGLAWDGTSFFHINGQVGQAHQLDVFDAAFAPVNSYPVTTDPRSIFTVGNQLYLREAYTSNIVKVDATGNVSAGVTLASAPNGGDAPVVYDALGDQLVSAINGNVQRWKFVDGADLAPVTLVGYGQPGEGDGYYGQWSAVASGGYLLTHTSGGGLSVWNLATGTRLKTVTLNGADPGGGSGGITLSFAKNLVWIRDATSGSATWRGYDLGL